MGTWLVDLAGKCAVSAQRLSTAGSTCSTSRSEASCMPRLQCVNWRRWSDEMGQSHHIRDGRPAPHL